MGHRITFVDNGRKALEALTLHQYDLILMDGRMPEMDGATAIRLIRAAGDGKFHIPDPGIRIIMLTANADTESRNFYLSCGADDFLVKPIDEVALHHSLERAIEALLAANVALLPRFQNAQKALDAMFGSAPLPEDCDADAAPAEPAEDPESRSAVLKIRMKEAFYEDLSRRLPELEQATAARDFQTLANIFHSLKGSAGYIWPDGDLRGLSAALEKAADAQDWGAIEQRLPELRKMLDDVMRGMDA
jgi:CheY-like chemotaxis protein